MELLDQSDYGAGRFFRGATPGHRPLQEVPTPALDGTSIDLENWKKLSSYFGTAKNGKLCGQTQARMVLLAFPTVRIPVRYELVPLAEGERTVAARLLNGLRRDDLVLIDRGFWSYGLFWQIQSQARSSAFGSWLA